MGSKEKTALKELKTIKRYALGEYIISVSEAERLIRKAKKEGMKEAINKMEKMFSVATTDDYLESERG